MKSHVTKLTSLAILFIIPIFFILVTTIYFAPLNPYGFRNPFTQGVGATRIEFVHQGCLGGCLAYTVIIYSATYLRPARFNVYSEYEDRGSPNQKSTKGLRRLTKSQADKIFSSIPENYFNLPDEVGICGLYDGESINVSIDSFFVPKNVSGCPQTKDVQSFIEKTEKTLGIKKILGIKEDSKISGAATY